MFETLKSVFKVKEMRRKLLYLIWMIFVIRIGSQLPVPGVDSDFFKQWFESNTGDAFNFFDAFTGGSFTQMSIFALNITPYITSSIIIQLLPLPFRHWKRCSVTEKKEEKSLQQSHVM